MAYSETVYPSTLVPIGGGFMSQPHVNTNGVSHQVVGEGVSSAAVTITLESSRDGLTWLALGTATPAAGGFFRIAASSAARNLRLNASATTTITNGLIAAHD
jgi:hypothetical protein